MSSSQSSYTNKLAESTSPYLLQHAHNPVEWYPWGEEALQKAKEENKLILLSIGYSTCYWCHVMEREVFEDPAIAGVMNKYFINIKIDREERPDLDELYMLATQILTRRGGWPNNVFLTPDLKPFYAGTYFPPKDNPLTGQPGFATLITQLQAIWERKEKELRKEADQFTFYLRHLLEKTTPADTSLPYHALESALQHFEQNFDAKEGGFYQAPKFPNEATLLYLLGEYTFRHKEKALRMAKKTLHGIMAGGIYDHVGGGLHRYATDDAWRVPHFEKMLYNQALFVRCLTEMYVIDPQPYYKDIVEQTLAFVERSLRHEGGAFFTALDAETDGVEGAYYAWEEADLQAILPDEQARMFFTLYGLEPIPAVPGHKHADGQCLYAKKTLLDMAADLGLSYPALYQTIKADLETLRLHRNRRPFPRRDDKIILAWNGLMVRALADAGRIFGNAHYITQAEEAVQFLLKEMRREDGGVYRIWSQGKTHIPGFLEDYSFLIDALLATYHVTKKKQYLDDAVVLAEKVEVLFRDTKLGGYYFTDGREPLLVRIKNASDAAMPSGAGVMVQVLLELYQLTQQKQWLEWAEKALLASGEEVAQFPPQYTTLLHAMMRYAVLTGSAMDIKPMELPVTSLHGEEQVEVTLETTPKRPKRGEVVKLMVHFTMAGGWHIYSHTSLQENRVPTSVSIQCEDEALEVKAVQYPLPEVQTLEGEHVALYQNKITIPVSLVYHGKTPSVTVRVMVRFQPCTYSECLNVVDKVYPVTLAFA